MTEQLIDIALKYAKWGWPVLPLYSPIRGKCDCGADCKSPGKHPRIKGGVNAASLDLECVLNWWQQWPHANVGIATGRVSNLVVMDLDERHGGVHSWTQWEKTHSTKTSLIAKTGGGFHLFFDAQGHEIKSRAGILPGVDVRADGGYIVAAGSLHHSGVPYSWICNETNTPSPLSDELRSLLVGDASTSFSPSLRSGENCARDDNGLQILEGGRNDFLTRIAGLLRREACTPELIKRTLDAVNYSVCSPSLDFVEVQKIAYGMSRYDSKWGEISSPVIKNSEAPQLNPEILPSIMRNWVNDAAERMQVPPEFFAAPCLVAFASVVGRQAGIFPKQEDNWFKVPNLWGAIIARPGLFKSPAILESTSFLRRLADKATSQYEIESLKSEINTDSINAQIEGLKEAIKKAAREQKSQEEIEEIQDRMHQLRTSLDDQTCIHKRFIVNDSTVEKLAVILKENPNGVLLLRDELAGWGASINRREGDREFYLESWNGNGPFTHDRIGRGTIHIANLCLSIFGGIQPSKIDSLCSPLGGGSDGLIQRFQVLVFPDSPKTWKNVDRKPREAEYKALADVFAKASNLSTHYPSAKDGLRFSNQAQDQFNVWRNALEHKLRSGEIESEEFESHLAKYRSLVPSLSLLFEIMYALSESRPLHNVGAKSTEKAIELAHYLERHAMKVYNEELSIAQKGAQLLAQKIKSGAVKDGDSLRSIYRRHWSWLDTSEKLDKAISKLEECSWLLVETVTNHTGKSNVIRINPKVYQFSFPG